MDVWSRLSLRVKLLSLVMMAALVCVVSASTVSYLRSRSALSEISTNQLISMREIAKKRLMTFFSDSKTFTKSLMKSRLVEGLFLAYEGAFYGNAFFPGKDQIITGSQYRRLNEIYHDRVLHQVQSYHLANLLLVTTSGQVIFSAQKDVEGSYLGRNLISGKYKGSSLGSCFSAALRSDGDGLILSDFEYNEVVGETVAFMCGKQLAEFDHLSEGISKGDVMGVVVTQFNVAEVNKMLSERNGMGETGQAYIVGSDRLLRSDFFVNQETFNVNAVFKEERTIDSESVQLALGGKSGYIIEMNPSGFEVVAAYTPIQIFGNTWAIIAEKQTSEIFAPIRSMVWVIVLGSLLVFVVIAVLSYFITESIVSPVIQANRTLRDVASSLASRALELLKSSDELRGGAQGQVSAIQQTVSTLNQLAAVADRSVHNVQFSTEKSLESERVAQEGQASIQEMLSAIQDINSSNSNMMGKVDESNKKMEEIIEVISRISEKTAVINDIAFQTKLLSFNASVEAARAGVHGRGFSVVAEEVGSLARVSGQSATEISNMLNESVATVKSIVDQTRSNVAQAMDDGNKKVEAGVVVANRCGDIFANVVGNVKEVAQLIEEIQSSTVEQNEGVSNITQAMTDIEGTTQRTSLIANLSADSSKGLSSEAEVLNKVVTDIEMRIYGSQSNGKKRSDLGGGRKQPAKRVYGPFGKKNAA